MAEGNCGELNLLQATGSETGQKLLPHSASGVIDKSNTGELQGFFFIRSGDACVSNLTG